ncbi:putative histone acetyltransferase [Dioscorea sansibarensis]
MADKRRISGSEASSPLAPSISGFISRKNHWRGLSNPSNADLWLRLFDEGYGADVLVVTNGCIIPAHAIILGMASPVLKNMIRQSKSRKGGRRIISISGAPDQAIRAFLRFIYSSCYEQEEMNQYVLHLLVLSHVFVITSLKKLCVQQLEKRLITVENVADVLQLACLCDAPRLVLVCHRLIIQNFTSVSATDGWKVMKQSNPKLEREILESLVDADSKRKEKQRKLKERKIYLQLNEAMEALVHICRNGCRTIGPRDKALKGSSCDFPACKGIELLIRHFAACKHRALGGCIQCKRMWQLLELHSRLCSTRDGCKVPLCGHFKDKVMQQNKKDEMKWKLLVSKLMEVKTTSLFT